MSYNVCCLPWRYSDDVSGLTAAASGNEVIKYASLIKTSTNGNSAANYTAVSCVPLTKSHDMIASVAPAIVCTLICAQPPANIVYCKKSWAGLFESRLTLTQD